ncbi:MAG TPA: serine hydrolase domain-containing protein, partial [Thermomicrobiales bacterium]
MTAGRWAAVRGYTLETMARHAIPAVALAVSEAGREVFAEGFGVREVGVGGEITPDTLFGVASVTKGFTALAILQLAEAGKLSVDDPVVRYLPAYRTPDPAAARATTLHHFLTHTAGLPPLASRFFALARATADDPYAAPRPAWIADHPPLDNADDLLAYIAGLDFAPLGAPGEYFSYCNEGFALLGAIIERVSGQPYAEYVQTNILDPLGMKRSTFDRRPLTGRADVAALHIAREVDGRRTVLAAPQPSYLPLWYPAGGLNTSARELLRYLEIYRTGGLSGGARLLSAAGIARMVTPHIVGGGPGASYGYGLGIRENYHGVWLIQHGGGSKGIASHVLVAPERGYTAVVLTNLAEMPADRLALAPLNQSLGLPLEAPFVSYGTATYPPAQLARYAGNYRGGEGTLLAAAVESGQLIVRF